MQDEMYHDFPKPKTARNVLLVIISILVLIGIGYFGYQKFLASNEEENSGNKITNTPPGASPSGSVNPSGSPSVTPSTSATPDLKVPAGETLITSSAADTNGDNKEEILVVTKMDGKYHVYILDTDKKVIFEDKTLDRKPVRVATQTYDSSKDTALSWMLIFSEDSGDLAFIHWNGTKYEIPRAEGI